MRLLLSLRAGLGWPAAIRPASVLASVLAGVLAAGAVAGCGTATHQLPSVAPTTRLASGPAVGDRLTDLAMTSMATGYGLFVAQGETRCTALVGRTQDGARTFTGLARVTSWSCGGNEPAATLAADDRGDVFLYGPRLFVSHDRGRTWAAGQTRRAGLVDGAVLGVAAYGPSVWLLQADCPRAGSASHCSLRLAESPDGGRTWRPARAQPQGSTVPVAWSSPADEPPAGQNWLVRTGPNAAYVLGAPSVSSHQHASSSPLWYTADGGGSWTRRRVPCGVAAVTVALSAAPGGALAAVCASEPGAGFQSKSTAISTDGGRTWHVHVACRVLGAGCHAVLASGYLGQIDALSARVVYLVGDRSALLVTTDGGRSWRAVRPEIGDGSGGTAQVMFFGHRDGLVLGDDQHHDDRPAVWRTVDGGLHWTVSDHLT